MKKKSRLESTGKKKPTAKKRAAPKKSVEASGPKKKDLKQQGKTRKEAAPAKKAPLRSKPAAKSKSTTGAKRKKVAAAGKPKVSMRDLLFRKFDTGLRKEVTVESPYEQKAPPKLPDAPPFVTGYDEEQTKQIRSLLFKQFDLKAEPVVEDIKEAEPIPEDVKRPEPPEKEVAEQALPDEPAIAPPSGPEVLREYEPPAPVLPEGPGPMAKAIRPGLIGLAVLIAILVGASLANRDNFYLKEVNGAVQVWRGKFAPTGTELVVSLDGMELSQPVKDVYSKKEVYQIAFGCFQDKADALLNEAEGPNFTKIKRYLNQAASYAPTSELGRMIQLRLDGINFLVLLHRADVALSRGTLPDLKAAKACLDRAGFHASIDYQRELFGKRKAVVDRAIAAFEAK